MNFSTYDDAKPQSLIRSHSRPIAFVRAQGGATWPSDAESPACNVGTLFELTGTTQRIQIHGTPDEFDALAAALTDAANKSRESVKRLQEKRAALKSANQ